MRRKSLTVRHFLSAVVITRRPWFNKKKPKQICIFISVCDHRHFESVYKEWKKYQPQNKIENKKKISRCDRVLYNKSHRDIVIIRCENRSFCRISARSFWHNDFLHRRQTSISSKTHCLKKKQSRNLAAKYTNRKIKLKTKKKFDDVTACCVVYYSRFRLWAWRQLWADVCDRLINFVPVWSCFTNCTSLVMYYYTFPKCALYSL